MIYISKCDSEFKSCVGEGSRVIAQIKEFESKCKATQFFLHQENLTMKKSQPN